MAVFLNGHNVLARSFIETGFGFALAVVLQLAQGGGLLLALAEGRFLNAEITELALIDDENLGLDELAADREVFVGEEFSEFNATNGINTKFELECEAGAIRGTRLCSSWPAGWWRFMRFGWKPT